MGESEWLDHAKLTGSVILFGVLVIPSLIFTLALEGYYKLTGRGGMG